MNHPKPEATLPRVKVRVQGISAMCCASEHETEFNTTMRDYPTYVSDSFMKAELAKARAEVIEKLELEFDRKLQSIMAGNLSVLVDSYRRQINNVFEAARAEAKEAGE